MKGWREVTVLFLSLVVAQEREKFLEITGSKSVELAPSEDVLRSPEEVQSRDLLPFHHSPVAVI